MPSERKTLRKYEILRNSRNINILFASEIPDNIIRHSMYSYPIRCRFCYKKSDSKENSLQALFAVPKRNFKRAVKRNKMRRRMKESYRLSKSELKDLVCKKNISVFIHLSYNSNEELNYNRIDNAIKTIIKEIIDKLSCNVN